MTSERCLGIFYDMFLIFMETHDISLVCLRLNGRVTDFGVSWKLGHHQNSSGNSMTTEQVAGSLKVITNTQELQLAPPFSPCLCLSSQLFQCHESSLWLDVKRKALNACISFMYATISIVVADRFIYSLLLVRNHSIFTVKSPSSFIKSPFLWRRRHLFIGSFDSTRICW